MEKGIVILVSAMLLMGMVSAASGSFGEYASSNPCHCLEFNTTSTAHQWILINTYNKSLNFTVTEPNMSNIYLNVSALKGIMPPQSTYVINITAISFSSTNQSGYITAYAIPNANASGETIRIGTAKLLEVAANSMVEKGQAPEGIPAQIASNSNQPSNSSQPGHIGTVISANNKTLSGNGTAAAAGNDVVSYLIGVVVILIVAILAIVYYFTRQSNASRKTARRKRR